MYSSSGRADTATHPPEGPNVCRGFVVHLVFCGLDSPGLRDMLPRQTMDLLDTQVHGIIGEAGFTRLVGAFYRRVPGDDILGPLYPKADMSGAERRLCQFLVQRFGGPDLYSQTRGHPRLRARHARFRVDQVARDRWVKLMLEAMEEAELPAQVHPPLRRFFHEASTFLLNHPQS